MAFTLGQIGSFALAIIGLTLTILNIIDKTTIMKERAGKPMELLDGRVRELEQWKEKVDSRLEDGNKRFQNITASNIVTQKALLALMDNAMDESNVEELKKARADLYNYLAEH